MRDKDVIMIREPELGPPERLYLPQILDGLRTTLRHLFSARRRRALVVEYPEKEVALDLTAPDAETLLVTWLGELIYLNERDGVVFTEFDLEEVTPTHLRGTARGGRPGEFRRFVKAATFSGLAIRPTDRGLETTITFDV